MQDTICRSAGFAIGLGEYQCGWCYITIVYALNGKCALYTNNATAKWPKKYPGNFETEII